MNQEENIILYDYLLENLENSKNGFSYYWNIKIFRIYYIPNIEFSVFTSQNFFYHETVKLTERLENTFPKIKKIVEYILEFNPNGI